LIFSEPDNKEVGGDIKRNQKGEGNNWVPPNHEIVQDEEEVVRNLPSCETEGENTDTNDTAFDW